MTELTAAERDELWDASGKLKHIVAAVERIVAARVASAAAERDEQIRALANDVWRATPCGCGHRADLHTNPVYPDEVAICRGHVLCGCGWSFTRIVQHRLRALVDAAPAGGEGPQT